MKLIDKPVVNFLAHTNMFTWNMFIHFPVLKSQFVAETIGIDLISHAGSEAQADALLQQIAKISKDFLFGRLPIRSREYQEFRLSREVDVIKEVLEYQLAFVIASTASGSLFTGYEAKSEFNKGFITGIESAVNQLTSKFRVWESIPAHLIRVGY